MAAHRTWLAIGITGFFAGLGLFLAVPGRELAHLGLFIAIAAPVVAFYRLMKPAIGKRHCPAKPEWTEDAAGQ